MKLQAFNHIAIVQTAFLGDAALALYLVQEIRALHPTVRISFVCTEQAAELIRCATAVDEVVVFDKRNTDRGFKGMARVARLLRQHKVDCVIALQRSLRTAALVRWSKVKFSVGFKQASASFLYSTRVPWELSKHEVERNHDLLSIFDDTLQSSVPQHVELRTDEIDVVASQLGLRVEDVQSSVVLAPGSVWATKRWTSQGFRDLAQTLRNEGRRVLLIGAESDRALCESIASDGVAMSLAGRTTMKQTLSILKSATVVVCNDSAPTHLAALSGTRCVVIYGSTLPAFGFAPRGEKDQVVECKDLSCRPCGLHGRSACPRATLECLTRIDSTMVRQAVMRAEA